MKTLVRNTFLEYINYTIIERLNVLNTFRNIKYTRYLITFFSYTFIRPQLLKINSPYRLYLLY